MSIESSLEKLQVSNADLDLLRSVEKQLKSSPSEKLQKTKLVALIKLDRYQSAFDFVRKSPQDHPVEAAYVFYKLGKIDLLRNLAKNSPLPGVQLSLAQAEYRIGNFSVAEHILDKIDIDDEDVPTNLQAIRASRGLNVEGDSFEALFAKGYSLLYQDPDRASDILSEAKQVAEDDYDADTVLVQAALVKYLQGNTDEAKALLERTKASTEDKTISQIAGNNLLCFQPLPEGLEQCQKLLRDNYSTDFANATATQAAAYTFNKLLLESRAGRRIGTVANRHTSLYPFSLAPRVLALQTHTTKMLRSELAKNPTDTGLALALVTKLPPSEGANVIINLCSALTAADMKKDLTPGLAGLIVAACKIKGVPQDIAKYLRLFPVEDAETARHLAASDNEADVLKAHEFFSQNCDDFSERAGGMLLTQPESAETPREVPSVSDLIAEIDVANLEKEGMTPFIPRRVVTSKPTIRKKRSGKPKLPADYDPAKQPDPERWLAKMDRSTYKRKKKGSSQGASQGSAQGSVQSHASSPSPGPVVSSSAKKNKKKKGKK